MNSNEQAHILVHDLIRQNQELMRQLREKEKEVSRLRELAMMDPLTNILNRRAFFMRLEAEIERCQRYKHNLILAMIDVDHFKEFNDREGHLQGDEALKKIVALITQSLRKSDLMGRYGGEEFLILLPETNMEQGVEICERLREMIASDSFELTLSIGIASFPGKEKTAQELLRSADRALYLAKRSGRNQIARAFA